MLKNVTMPAILISLIAGNINAQEINTDINATSNITITQRLAVFPLKMSELSRRNRSRIRTKFQTILGRRNNYFILGPDQVKVILQSQGLSTTTECLSVECLASFGKNVEVDFAIGGEIKKVPYGLSISLSLVNSIQSIQMNSISKIIRGGVI